jgi:hypothetical protein
MFLFSGVNTRGAFEGSKKAEKILKKFMPAAYATSGQGIIIGSDGISQH